MTTQDFSAIRLQEVLSENSELRERLRAQSLRLAEAEEIARYYSEPSNYDLSPTVGDIVFQNRLVNDCEASDNNVNTRVAGLRARLYLRRYAGISHT